MPAVHSSVPTSAPTSPVVTSPESSTPSVSPSNEAAGEAPPGGPRRCAGVVALALEPERALHERLALRHRAVVVVGAGLLVFVLERLLGPRGAVAPQGDAGDAHLGRGVVGGEPIGDPLDHLACDGAPEPGDPGLLQRVGVLDGAGGGGVGDPRVGRIRQRERHGLGALVDGVVEDGHRHGLGDVVGREGERSAGCGVVGAGGGAAVRCRVLDGDRERRRAVERDDEVQGHAGVFLHARVGDREHGGPAHRRARGVRKCPVVGRAHRPRCGARAASGQGHDDVAPPERLDGDGPVLVAALGGAPRFLHGSAGDGERMVAQRRVADFGVLAERQIEAEAVRFARPAVLARHGAEARGELVLVPGRRVFAVADGAGRPALGVDHRGSARLVDVEQERLVAVLDGVVDDGHADRLRGLAGRELEGSARSRVVAFTRLEAFGGGPRDRLVVDGDALARRRGERHREGDVRVGALSPFGVGDGQSGQWLGPARGVVGELPRAGADGLAAFASRRCAERCVPAPAAVAHPCGHVLADGLGVGQGHGASCERE